MAELDNPDDFHSAPAIALYCSNLYWTLGTNIIGKLNLLFFETVETDRIAIRY